MGKHISATLSILMSAGLVVATEQVEDVESKWVAPEAARAAVNPISLTPEVIAEGQRLYERNCLTCHGAKGKGDGPATPFIETSPTDLSRPAAQSRMTDGEIFWKVTEGRNPMPSFKKKLSEEERWKLVYYVRSLRAH